MTLHDNWLVFDDSGEEINHRLYYWLLPVPLALLERFGANLSIQLYFSKDNLI